MVVLSHSIQQPVIWNVSRRCHRLINMTGTRGFLRLTPIVATWLVLLLVLVVVEPAMAQPAVLTIALPDAVSLSERSNISRRDDGRYVGLINILVTGNLSRSGAPVVTDTGYQSAYDGLFLRFEQTRRDMNQVARPVEYRMALQFGHC